MEVVDGTTAFADIFAEFDARFHIFICCFDSLQNI
jgi:hypothetical protein